MKAPSKSTAKKKAKPASAAVLYLYGISQLPERAAPAIAAEGIDGSAAVEAIRCKNNLCWVSRVSKQEFADELNQRMQELDWLASAGLRHQRVVSEISQQLVTLPARFGTVFLNEASLARHIEERQDVLREAFERVADADEWGIKVFQIAKPKTAAPITAASGSDYLKQKAQTLRPVSNKIDDAVRAFAATLAEFAVASGPGGKASAGQPGLIWQGSFLIRRQDQPKLEATLKQYAAQWEGVRRIDCSGPWPPYSFVEEHVH